LIKPKTGGFDHVLMGFGQRLWVELSDTKIPFLFRPLKPRRLRISNLFAEARPCGSVWSEDPFLAFLKIG